MFACFDSSQPPQVTSNETVDSYLNSVFDYSWGEENKGDKDLHFPILEKIKDRSIISKI